ncbi:MAG: hypothetical protein AAGI51_06470 [Pseudomonadota bacterium]
MAYYKGHVFAGTSRATMFLLGAGDKGGMKDVSLDAWPVEMEQKVYTPEFEHTTGRAEIWRMKPGIDGWTRVYRAPMVHGTDGTHMSRDLGYRAMAVYQGDGDPEPALYVSSWSRSRGEGMQFLRSYDGEAFEAVGPKGLAGLDATSTRSLVPFKGRIFTSPTGATAGRQNASGVAIVYETTDFEAGDWKACNANGFGDDTNDGVFEMIATDTHLYAGTLNVKRGYQVWRTTAEGAPPYDWEPMLLDGAGRGQLNQAAVSMSFFQGAVFVGSGIQKGGIDKQNKIGPAGPELIRINADGSHDVIMGETRTEAGPLSGMMPGWNNIFCGSIWKQNVHDGWLYAGTQDWLAFLLYKDFEKLDSPAARLLRRIDMESFVETGGGYDLWRSRDGENWVPVTRCGFENPYNHGVRNILSTPHGVFIGSCNQFGPKSAFRTEDGGWEYLSNPRGGTEVWQGFAG